MHVPAISASTSTIPNARRPHRGWAYRWATLFLIALPTLANGQDTVERSPKIVLLFDVSTSMNTIDGPVQPGVDPATLPSRQERVIQFLTTKGGASRQIPGDASAFLNRLLSKASVTAYRFGAELSPLDAAHFSSGEIWPAEQWRRWLKSEGGDRAGTNIARSALQMLQREKDSYLQAIVIFSDGRANRGTRQEIEAFLAEVNRPDRPIAVFTVGVGNSSTLPRVALGDLQAPTEVRPDEKFSVRVPVRGIGLAGEAFQVVLEAQRVQDAFRQPVVREKRYLNGPMTRKFKSDEEETVDFAIDLTALDIDAKSEDRPGVWQFTARVASHRREAFVGTEHVSEPLRVVVRDKKPRVLLLAGGPTREYQFLRAFLGREMQEKRLDVSILLQTWNAEGVEAPIDGEGYLKKFPAKLDADVIIAIDPDWSLLSTSALTTMRDWVDTHAGGVVFVAGPVHSHRLARPGGLDLSALQAIYPVIPRDGRLLRLGLPDMNSDPTRPYALQFAPGADKLDFIRLVDVPGWKNFFWNDANFAGNASTDRIPRRGFFQYYPVERLRPGSTVIATFAGPKESRINEKTDTFQDQQPFIVSMRYGNGKTLYIGSPETWRLRQYKEAAHERFWLGLIRFMAKDAPAPKAPGPDGVQPQAKPIREGDDVRVDFGHLYQLASKADPLLRKLPADSREQIEATLRQSAKFPQAPGSQDLPWLFFRLASADVIPLCLEKRSPRQFPREAPASLLPPRQKEYFDALFKDKQPVRILIIDGEGARGRAAEGDSFFLRHAIESIPGKPFTIVFGDEAGGAAVKAIDRDDLARFKAIFLVNVRELDAVQVASLEKFAAEGGGVAFFLGPLVNSAFYNKTLFKAGKGVFPVPLADGNAPVKREAGDGEPLLVREDLFADADRMPIFGASADLRSIWSKLPLRVHRYYQVARLSWRPESGRSMELATLPNDRPTKDFQEATLGIIRGPLLRKLHEDRDNKASLTIVERHCNILERLIAPDSEKKAFDLALALDEMLRDRTLTNFWKLAGARPLLEELVRLRHQTRYGDPLIVGGPFGKGRTVAVLTTAGKGWNDFAAGGPASLLYPAFIEETANYLTGQQREEQPRPPRGTGKAGAPGLFGIAPAYSVLKPAAKESPKNASSVYLVTPDARLQFRGKLLGDAGLSKANWVVRVTAIPAKDSKHSPDAEQSFPLEVFYELQAVRAHDEVTREILAGVQGKPFPRGYARTHDLADESGFDFRKHLGNLKAKENEVQRPYLVQLWISVASADGTTTRSEKPMQFLIVSENQVLAQSNREGIKLADRLEIAHAKLRDAETRLDEQIQSLSKPDVDRSTVVVRLGVVGTTLRESGTMVREVNDDVKRILRDMDQNRAKKSSIAKVTKVFDALQALVTPLDQAEGIFITLPKLAEKDKSEVVLKQARAARQELKTLKSGLDRALDAVDSWAVESRLIELLLQIEQRSLEERGIRERLIQDLLDPASREKK